MYMEKEKLANSFMLIFYFIPLQVKKNEKFDITDKVTNI